jgi:hypothetical protein
MSGDANVTLGVAGGPPAVAVWAENPAWSALAAAQPDCARGAATTAALAAVPPLVGAAAAPAGAVVLQAGVAPAAAAARAAGGGGAAAGGARTPGARADAVPALALPLALPSSLAPPGAWEIPSAPAPAADAPLQLLGLTLPLVELAGSGAVAAGTASARLRLLAELWACGLPPLP